MDEHGRLEEAEHNALQASFILNQLQANKQVYGSNSILTGAQPADIQLGLRYIDRALEHFPDSPNYLNLKALLLIDSGTDKAAGIRLLERAHELDPRDITIESNLEKARSSACFIATAVYGSDTTTEVLALRTWRDERLSKSHVGRALIRIYYRASPPAAKAIMGRTRLRSILRVAVVSPFVRLISKR